MANPEHLALLDSGIESWNRWRTTNPAIRPDLSNVSLSGRWLAHSDFSHCNLTETHLNHADLRGCNFRRANLAAASAQKADLTGATCAEIYAAGANFSGATLSNVELSSGDLTSAHLTDADLGSADLNDSDLSKASLFQVNLQKASLIRSKLSWANLTKVDLRGATLRACDLTGASIIEADLSGADLSMANLRYTRLIDSRLDKSNLNGCRVYGSAVWNLSAVDAVQSDIAVTPPDEVTVTVDSLEIAQFVYLMLNNAKIRQIIDAVSSKAVLILGRFSGERMLILQAIREALRARSYLPILFDFSAPSRRDLTETVSTLAHLARFVLADITEARSIPQELMTIVPHLPSVPVQPLLAATERPYGMFEHFRSFPWLLDTVLYSDVDSLLRSFDDNVIRPAEARVRSFAQHSIDDG